MTTEFRPVSSGHTLVSGQRALIQSSPGFNVTLPLNPDVGSWVNLADASDSWDTHPVLVHRNGSLIEGIADTLLLDVTSHLAMIFVGSDIGWKAIPILPADPAPVNSSRLVRVPVPVSGLSAPAWGATGFVATTTYIAVDHDLGRFLVYTGNGTAHSWLRFSGTPL